MAAYYNEFDPKAAAWLRELVRGGHLPEGEVDARDIRQVVATDLRGFAQHHFFAGIGGWPLALRLAGWPDDRPVWTGSCPCQPFSTAGQRKGRADDRHLWPEFRRLVAECRPPVCFGEQVASRLGRDWLAGVRATWKHWAMPSGPPICALRASPRPTSGSGCSGWQTPMAGNPGTEDYNPAGNTDSSRRTVELCGWATPAARDWKSGDASEATMAKNARPLNEQAVNLAGWATPHCPRANDSDTGSASNYAETLGQTPSSSPAGTGRRAVLNPEFSRWLMGYPAAWGCCGATAMQSCRRSRRPSSKRTSKREASDG
jgi:hypothetical protein